jgi:hypothetical protein
MPRKLVIPFLGSTYRWVVGLVSLVAIGWGAVIALDTVDQARMRSRLQNIADDAAVAGVLMLASLAEQGPDVAQRAATKAATDQVIGRTGANPISVRPSSSNLTVSVEVSAPSPLRISGLLHDATAIDVIGTASYLPPVEQPELLANRLRGWRSYAQTK